MMAFFVFSANTVFPIAPQQVFLAIPLSFALTLASQRKLGGGSGMSIKTSFSCHSALICTNSRLTAQVRRRLGNGNKNEFFLPFRSPCTNFASAIKLPIFHPIISSTTQFFQVDYGSLHRTRFYRWISVYRP